VHPGIFNPLPLPVALTGKDGATCKKRKFSQLQANAVLRQAAKQAEVGNSYRREQRVYECKACRFYHLTSKDLWTGARNGKGGL
jgi:hypothetical protein